MSLSISLVLLLLIVAVIFLRSGAMKLSHALVCVFLGFLLAGTGVAPTLHNGIDATASLVSSIKP
ncbi:hypothetical protein [Streptomyces sp. VRA16 Mangrove soil]|uniref:hypothetical protein n=1 Tax=Streptomyces sp. VRA16 Mangrove soil TaxID=2817434 RepID=UPI001A9CD02A|nr:hypothetical protein [Streptomyces sp. VRA16 Mangrove soil]MBO1330346.1 hypothetical protein [Streptomyces sp. VRA16 Mangrove soil]